jgi:hypothetical protein
LECVCHNFVSRPARASGPSRKEPCGPPAGYLLPSYRTTQRPTANTSSVQSYCCDDSILFGCDVPSLRMRFPTFRMNELQRLFEPWRSRITFLGKVESYPVKQPHYRTPGSSAIPLWEPRTSEI